MKALQVMVRTPEHVPVLLPALLRARHSMAILLVAILLVHTGNLRAATSVQLSIKNKADASGQISVVTGKSLKVRFEVIEDADKLLSKKDEIQLLRVRDNGVVSSANRGKKDSGVVKLDIDVPAGEQLYVQYVLKKGGKIISRVSHPSDPGYIPLAAVADTKAGGASAQTAGNGPVKIKSLDVIGVSLGMNLAETEQVLKTRYPDFYVVPINYKSYGKQWTGILAAMPKSKHKHEVVLVDFTQPPLEARAIAITRYKEYPADATPSLESLETGLLKKYGDWSSADATTRGGYRKIYNWRSSQEPCIGETLYASFGRLRQIVDEGTLSRVIGDAYGDPSQYITGFREYAELNSQTPSCDKQIAVEVHYRPDQSLSPVNKLITVVADFPGYYDSEVAFSEMATAYREQQNAEAVQKGGEPEL